MNGARGVSSRQMRATCSSLLTGILLVLLAPLSSLAAPPDFTKGESIPEGYDHDWNLGATGARGWIYSERLVTSDARQIKVTEVAEGSPADGVLAAGDVILGVAGKPFSYDPRTEFGKALTVAESEAGAGKLSLFRWRAGETATVEIKLPVLGTYSATAPYDCPKSKRIFELGCEALAKRMAEDDYARGQNAITRSLNALALLASGDKKYLPLIEKEAKWAADYSARSMQTWYYGYVITLLAEYVMITGDKSVMPGLKRLAMEAATGQSIVGSWGHKFAGPDGRLLGYGMMNAPGIPLTIGLVTAKEAGVDDPALDLAIDRSAKLLRFYAGKGAVPYGDHHPWKESHEDNGKCGMAAVLFNLKNESDTAEYFSRMSVASHGPERDCGHTGNFWNMAWAMPSVAQSGPHATGAWMKEFGSWYYDLARQWDGSFRHQGPPQQRRDSTGRWDSTGAYLLAYAQPLKKTLLTGKRPAAVPQLDAAAAQGLINDGRGWSNKDRTSAYDALGADVLFECLASWSPIVRERAAMAFARRKEIPVPALVELLGSENLYARLGACQALARAGGKAAPAVPALREALKADDLWLRVKAADALAAIGQPAMVAVPELLTMLAKGATEDDPRAMEQRYLSFALFNSRGGLLGRSLEGVDREELMKAVRAGLQNEDGRARSSFTSVYRNLSFEEIKPLLPAIYEAIKTPSPSGIMFADGVRMGGLELFAKHRISEGVELLAFYARYMKPHASEHRIKKVMDLLKTYGAHGERVIPDLEKTIHYFENDEPDFPKRLSLQKAQVVKETIEAIKASDERPELISLEDL